MIKALLLLSALITLPSCTSWHINQLAAQLPSAGPQTTLDQMNGIDPSLQDQAQYLLNRGILALYTGDFQSSRQDLEQAKSIMTTMQSISITENLAALSVNETLRTYSGSPTDQVLVHLMLGLNYLFSGDRDGARVEMLQANVTMQKLDDGSSDIGQLASVRYFAGTIYELNGEYDDALISYQRAYEIMQARHEPIPLALQMALLNVSKRQGRDTDYQSYAKAFNSSAQIATTNEVEWLLFYFDGVVSSKHENRLSVYSPKAQTMVSVVLPAYMPSYYRPRSLSLSAQNQSIPSSIIENMEARARDDLSQESAKVLAAATLRAVSKYSMVREAQSKDDAAGLLMNLLTVTTEQADVRSWNMLPASIQIARIKAPASETVTLPEWQVTLPSAKSLDASKIAAIMAFSINHRYFIYPTPVLNEKGATHDASNSE